MTRKAADVNDIVLKCALEEFLNKGFENASMRTIAENAGIGTGSIYRRFIDKEQIFVELVTPVIEELKSWISAEQQNYAGSDADTDWDSMQEYSKNKRVTILDFIYDNYKVFKLLLQCSGGTVYENFVHQMAEIHTKYTLQYIESSGNDCIKSGRISERFVHMISTAFQTAVFETVIHDVPKEAAEKDLKNLQDFLSEGWKLILHENSINTDSKNKGV